jgi:hypothetical protein
MGRRTARVSVKRCQMPRRSVGGLAISLTAEALEKHIAAHPGERAWIELAIEHGAIRKIAESEVTEND